MLHQMRLQDAPFNSIKAGTKDIEMRLYDEKRRSIKPGDIIEFTNIVTDEKYLSEIIKFSSLGNGIISIEVEYGISIISIQFSSLS